MNVGVERVLPLLLRQIMDVIDHHLVSVIVEQNVNRPHLLQSLLLDFLAVVLIFEVCRVEVALAAMLLHEFFRLLCVLLLFWQVGDEAVCALHGEEHCGGTADA